MQRDGNIEGRHGATDKLRLKHLSGLEAEILRDGIRSVKSRATQTLDYSFYLQYPELFQRPQPAAESPAVGFLAMAAKEQAEQAVMAAAGRRAVEEGAQYEVESQPAYAQAAASVQPASASAEAEPMDPVEAAEAIVAAAYEEIRTSGELATQPPIPIDIDEPSIQAEVADGMSKFEDYLARLAHDDASELADA